MIFDHYSREIIPVSMNFTGLYIWAFVLAPGIFATAIPQYGVTCIVAEAQQQSCVSGVFVALLEPGFSCPLRTVEQHNDNSMNFSPCLGGDVFKESSVEISLSGSLKRPEDA